MVGLLEVRGWALMVMALFLVACAPWREKAEPETVPSVKPLPERQDYVVVPEDSDVRIFVYRAGRLASKVGHNHVVSSPDIQGTAMLTRELVGSTVDIQIPGFEVEYEIARAEAEAGR